MTLVLAHSGHWLASLLYVVPVAALLGGLWITRRREERAPDDD